MSRTQKDPGDKGVRIESRVVAFLCVDVSITQKLQLLQASSGRRVYGKQDWPGHAAADKADDDGNLEVS